MILRERLALWFRPAFYLGQNAITLIGAVLTTSSAFTMIFFWAFELFIGGHFHPYIGILIFLILPGIFVAGLLLIPTGLWWRRRTLRRKGELPDEYPKIDFGQPMLRRTFAVVSGLTVLNGGILGTATYRGVEYMESVQFCGQTCHTVMIPEFTAYQNSPHQRVGCVQCHIGPGAPWFVRSKLSGVRQVFAVTFKTYSRPIPSPVQHLRPARETCEQCHWPQKFSGDKFVVRTQYSEDEANTPMTTVLVLKIGGVTHQGRIGIHGRHLDTFERISYISTDGRRQVIPRVSYVDDDGKTIEFVAQDVTLTPEDLARAESRKMDCVDCHNRPTHAFELPQRAVDKAMYEGRISPQLPWIKKKAVEVLRAEYPDRQTASLKIIQTLADFYKTSYPEIYKQHRAMVESSADSVKNIYLRNVFPEMKVTWGTHPNNIGHEDFLGCFRCHDGNHAAADGRVIKNDCDTCHAVLAMQETNPKILSDLGIKP
jgi:hypothetical protein